MSGPIIETERMVLRPPRASDEGPLGLYASDARVARMTTSIPHPYLPDMARDYLDRVASASSSEHVWVMDALPTGGAEFIGIIGYKPELAEIGYWVGPPFWETGYATEAVRALLGHLRRTGVGDVAGSVFFDNPASAQVLRKCGFEETHHRWEYSISRGVEVPVRRFLSRAA